MRWLHITDLHWGASDEQQMVAARALISAINSYSDKKFDVIFITGDIAFSGKNTEYESFGDGFQIDKISFFILMKMEELLGRIE